MSGADLSGTGPGDAGAEALRRWLDGELDAAAAPQLNAALRAEPRLLVALTPRLVVAAERAPHLRPARTASRPSRSRARGERARRPALAYFSMAAAALAAACVLALIWMARHQAPASAAAAVGAVASAEGLSDADSGAALPSGAPLRAHQRLRLADGGMATVSSSAGDAYVLAPGSLVTLCPERAHALRLEQGSVVVEAAHRQAPEALRMVAGGAEVTVVGTTFRLSLAAGMPQVAVSAGAVRVRRLLDGQEALLRAGESLVVAHSGALVPALDPVPGSRVLRVGAGEAYARLRDLPELGPGDLVMLPAVALHEAATLRVHGSSERPVRILGSAGTLLSGGGLDLSGTNGPRALLELEGDHAVVQGIACTGARNAEGNAAGVRIIGGDDIAVRWCVLRGCDVGVLVNGGGAIALAHDLIEGNGIRGPASAYGNLAAEGCQSLEARECRISAAVVGNDVRAEARRVRFEACAIGDGDDASAEIELLPLAGTEIDAAISGCLIHLKARTVGNRYRALALGPGRSAALVLDHDTIISDLPGLRLTMSGGNSRLTIDSTVARGHFVAIAEGFAAISGSHDWIGEGCALPPGFSALDGDPRIDAQGAPVPGSPLAGAAAAPAMAPAAAPAMAPAAADDARLEGAAMQPLDLPAGTPWPGGARCDIGALAAAADPARAP